MRVRTHLIAMPWAPPDTPSIQLACLKAHLDRAHQGRSDCRAYSAFFSILQDFKGGAFLEFFRAVEDYRESIYLLRCICAASGLRVFAASQSSRTC